MIKGSLDRYLAAHEVDVDVPVENLSISTASNSTVVGAGNGAVNVGEKARSSGYMFGLNGIGMCILKLPVEVVEIEVKGLQKFVMQVSLESLIITAYFDKHQHMLCVYRGQDIANTDR